MLEKSPVKLIPVVYVVYKSKGGLWRGFCTPYDVTCNAESMSEAKERLDKLVELYEEGLKKYHNPRRLVFKKLSDKEDKVLFEKIVWPKISQDIQKRMLASYLNYSQSFEEKGKEESSIRGSGFNAFYTHRSLAASPY
ncbi:MAG: hypothetical protein V1696_02395 [Candidatus Jorgensenbacteria bacterium]